MIIRKEVKDPPYMQNNEGLFFNDLRTCYLKTLFSGKIDKSFLSISFSFINPKN